MYYYLEKPKDDAALKKEYLEKIRELRPHLDEGFFKIASCPENIIIRKNMVCEVSLDYEIFMKMSYVEKVTSDYTKGYKIEARSDHLYVSEDRGSLQYRSNASDIFNFKVTKRLSVDKNNVETLYSEDSRNLNRYVSLDSYRDADTISQCFNLVGYSSESAFFDRIGLKVKEESIYSSEKESAERKIRSRDPEVRSIRCEGIQVPSGDVLNYGDGIIRFKWNTAFCDLLKG